MSTGPVRPGARRRRFTRRPASQAASMKPEAAASAVIHESRPDHWRRSWAATARVGDPTDDRRRRSDIQTSAQACGHATSSIRNVGRAGCGALATLDERLGRPINLPGAPAGTSYLGLPTRRSAAGPVIIYRSMLPSEGEGWLVVSLLSPTEYRNIGRAEELVTASPAAREIVNAVVAGTVATAGAATATGTAPSPNSLQHPADRWFGGDNRHRHVNHRGITVVRRRSA